MEYERKVTLHIDRFRNCDSWIGFVATELSKMDGVKLLVTDYTRAYFTISTTRHPEDVRATIERKFETNVIIVSQETSRPWPPPNLVPTASGFNNQNPDYSLSNVVNADDLVKAFLGVHKPDDLDSVEFTHSTRFSYSNVNRRRRNPGLLASTQDEDYYSQGAGGGGIRVGNDEHVPPPPRPPPYTQTAEPCAPPVHMAQAQDDNHHPWLYDYHGVSTNARDDDDDACDPACCCTII